MPSLCKWELASLIAPPRMWGAEIPHVTEIAAFFSPRRRLGGLLAIMIAALLVTTVDPKAVGTTSG